MTLESYKHRRSGEHDAPALLFRQGPHAVYWLGLAEETVFRCNTYLVIDGDQGIVIDPGGVNSYQALIGHIEQLIPLSSITAAVISHQDPDIAGSLAEWLSTRPDLLIITSPRTKVLLPHFGIREFSVFDIEADPVFRFRSGNALQFYPAPFLHSPMAFASFDEASGFMFTSDIFAALDSDWRLVVDDFPHHQEKMDLFHLEYMACNKAAVGFLETIAHLPIKAFLPQHGSIIPEAMVADAMEYLRNLQCGLDIAYPHL